MNLRIWLFRSTQHAKAAIPVVLLMLSALLWPTLAQAQFRGSLRGTVTDSQGAAVEGATVTLTNTQTNATLSSTTDANGIYQFNALPAAPYQLTVEKSGFAKKVMERVSIIPEQPNSLDVQLEVGQVQQSVTVSGTTYALDTETANIAGTVNQNEVQHMPSAGRDVFKLIELAPGVFGDNRQGAGGGANLPGTQGPGATGGSNGIFQTENGPQALAVGQQYENNGISIDGISTASAVWGGTTIITPSEDSVENVKVVANGYDAESGRFSGAQIQVTSMSGTNKFHGSAFFAAHRPGLDAYQRFNGQGNSVLRDNSFFDQFGGSVGGPIWKNKLFFFFDYETVRSPKAQTSTSNGWYDTAAFDGLAPSGSIAQQYLTFPGSSVASLGINPSTCANAGLTEGVDCATIPGQGLDIGSPLTSGLGTQDLGWTSTSNPGVGGGLDGVADIANFITSSASNYSKEQYNGRVDADVTTNDHVAFALYYVPQSTSFLNGPARQYNYFHHSQVNDAFSVIWNHIFSSTLLNEFRVNAAGWRWNEVASNPQSPVGLPTDNIDTVGSINISQFGPSVGSILNQWTYTYKDVATKVVGRNTIKFGGDLTRLFYLNDCAGCGVPHYNYFNIWDFLNDAPHSEGSSFDPNTGLPTTNRQDDREAIWGIFVQDDLKLRRNVTINFGLRYSFFGPLSSKQGNMFVAIPGAGANYMTDLMVQRGNSWNAQKDNLGPQIGFAWSPGMFNDRLVIRGGYGLNYNQEEIAISANIATNPGLTVSPTFSMSTPNSPNPGIIYAISSDVHSIYGYPANPNAVVSFGPNGIPTTGQVNVGIFPRDLPTMRTHHYSLQAQYDLGHDTVASLGYQGSLSRDIYFHENPNAAPAAAGDALNPQIGGGDYWGVSGRGNYNALLAELNHRFSHQFSADAQFTWAKSMDTSSAPYSEQPYPFNLDLNYGRSDYDVGKAFKLYGVWQPVLFRGDSAWMEKVLGGWSISGIFNLESGFPWSPTVSVQNGSLYCGTCGYGALFPASYLAKPGTDTSNDQFKTGSNYPNGGSAYFAVPTYTAYSGSNYGNSLPQAPGVHRNSLNGPGFKDLDLTLAKGFGLPNMPVLGENARIEFRVDAYNVFNNLNFDPTSISTNIANANFGQATSALGGRVVTLGARFSF
ncbi:MAG TPA: carboxypeptidase-like regulatory domain-containing protein [Candidatus Acidoferrales bacterium]|nr:carboxypeptidase-like regulatory domain-containing protein [Candidatus Acidoferrales bacterium]